MMTRTAAADIPAGGVPVGFVESSGNLSRLSPRQVEILRLLATGMKRQAVALELGVALSTVNAHLYLAWDRLDVGCTIEAFVALGWLRPR